MAIFFVKFSTSAGGIARSVIPAVPPSHNRKVHIMSSMLKAVVSFYSRREDKAFHRFKTRLSVEEKASEVFSN